MSSELVTIVVVPRERFSFSRQALESLYKRPSIPFKLIYVDGGSPRYIKKYLERESQVRNFKLIRRENYLVPNVARNIGLAEVKTKFVIFIDNDVMVTEKWLEHLVRCAEEEGAWLVGPIYCIGNPEDQIIHMAGGEARIHKRNQKRIFSEKHRLAGKFLPEVRHTLIREPVELVEFHCLLARTDIFQEIGFLDENLKGTREHIDLCLQVQQSNGMIVFEPQSVVTYVPPPPFKRSDIPYYLLRWSQEWTFPTLRHFNQKWDLADSQKMDQLVETWLKPHRRLALRSLRKTLHCVLGRGIGDWGIDRLERFIIKRHLKRA